MASGLSRSPPSARKPAWTEHPSFSPGGRARDPQSVCLASLGLQSGCGVQGGTGAAPRALSQGEDEIRDMQDPIWVPALPMNIVTLFYRGGPRSHE